MWIQIVFQCLVNANNKYYKSYLLELGGTEVENSIHTFCKKYHSINVKAISIKVTAIYLNKSTKYYIKTNIGQTNICDRLSKNPTCSHNYFFFIFYSPLSAVSKEWITKVSAFCGV